MNNNSTEGLKVKMTGNHFIIPYAGNKRLECKAIYELIKDNLNDIEYIIEPFCGTSAFSYYLSTLHPKKFKYMLNDNNSYLIELYNIFKDENKTNNLITKLNTYLPIDSKEKYDKICKQKDLDGYVISNKIYSIRAGLYPQGKKISEDIFNNMKKAPIVDFLRNEDIIITNNDYNELIEKYKDNSKALIFLDPPYLFTNNTWYSNPSVKIYEWLCTEELNKFKSLITVCIENNFFIKHIFKKYKQITYNKMYQPKKKKTEHIFILNKLN